MPPPPMYSCIASATRSRRRSRSTRATCPLSSRTRFSEWPLHGRLDRPLVSRGTAVKGRLAPYNGFRRMSMWRVARQDILVERLRDRRSPKFDDSFQLLAEMHLLLEVMHAHVARL